MPLPWLHSGRTMQSGFAPVRVADPVNRAMTIKQLRQLRLYIQRLCKARLLQHTSDSPFGFYKAGEQIHWYEINLYDITDEILRKLIPFLLRQQPDQPSDDSCSWMELVASGPKTPKILLSHWWGGRFRDLMCMIDMLVDAKSLSVSTPIWICTFANNQIRGEDFGERVAGFPFMGAIDAAELTVLVVDRNAGSLGRTWCGLEVHWTVDSEKDLEVYTPTGRVGGDRASSGPLIEAIKQWDIRETQASDICYSRHIFNFIAGVDEHAGLQSTTGGALTLERGRPMLQEGTGEHEAALFREHALRFESLNMAVRLEVRAPAVS